MDSRERRLYEYTSIGRTLDPGYPTNRVVLALLPVAAVAAGTVAAAGGAGPFDTALRAAGGALAAFGAWAVAREAAPDDEIWGAFLAMALGFGTFVLLWPPLVPVFAALFYARVAGRSTGLPATLPDSLIVAGLALFVAWRSGTPWPAVAGAAAFAFDALLPPGHARQWLLAGVCAAGAVALSSAGLAPRVVPIQPDPVPRAIATLLTVATIGLIAATRSCDAVCDATGEPVPVPRVRAAQTVTLLTALAFAAAGSSGIVGGSLIWAALAGVTSAAGARGLVRGVARRAA